MHRCSHHHHHLQDDTNRPLNPWPHLSAKARAIGYSAIAGIPVRVRVSTFATINLKNRHDTITPEILAEHIACEIAPLIVSSLSQRPPSLTEQADHDGFHQATGMVMVQRGIAAEAAVEVLRAHAWTQGRLVTDIADDVVAHTVSFFPSQDE